MYFNLEVKGRVLSPPPKKKNMLIQIEWFSLWIYMTVYCKGVLIKRFLSLFSPISKLWGGGATLGGGDQLLIKDVNLNKYTVIQYKVQYR